MAWTGWLTHDPIEGADRITRPVQIVHSRDAAVPDGAQQFHEQLAGPRDILWTDGGQLDFNDQPAQVGRALAATLDHFHRAL